MVFTRIVHVATKTQGVVVVGVIKEGLRFHRFGPQLVVVDWRGGDGASGGGPWNQWVWTLFSKFPGRVARLAMWEGPSAVPLVVDGNRHGVKRGSKAQSLFGRLNDAGGQVVKGDSVRGQGVGVAVEVLRDD